MGRPSDGLMRLGDRIQRAVRRSVSEAGGDPVDSGVGPNRRSVNLAGPRNVVAGSNIGGDTSVHVVSSEQEVRVRQSDGETVEETRAHSSEARL